METNKKDKPCSICSRVPYCNFEDFKKCKAQEWEQFTNSRSDGIIPDNILEVLEPKKHPGGRPPKFKTPEELEAKAEEYFKWCDANPIRIYRRKDAGANQTAKNGSGVKSQEGEAFANRPYTLDGLCLHLGIWDWSGFKNSEPYQTPEFSGVIRALEMRVRDQQVSGAMVGVYNSNLTARLNGISENVSVETAVPVKIVEDGLDD